MYFYYFIINEQKIGNESAFRAINSWFFAKRKGSGTELDRLKKEFVSLPKWQVRAKIVHWTILLPPPHSSKGSVNLLRLEMKRTLFASVVEVRFGVWNTNCWDLLRKPYLQPLTVHWTVKPNQPLRWNIDTNFEKRGWTFCSASWLISNLFIWVSFTK